MKSISIFEKIIFGIITVIVIVVLVRYLVSSKAIPSIDSFMASSTLATTSASSQINQDQFQYEIKEVHAPNGKISVKISDSPEKWSLGLGKRSYLDSDSGMLFIFPSEGKYSFWMKDMNFPIDLIWIGKDKKVVGIVSNFDPHSYPEVVFPNKLVTYVLEINANRAKDFGIATGTILKF